MGKTSINSKYRCYFNIRSKSKKKKNKRMTEVEEDEVLLKIEDEDETPLTVLDVQPGNIAGEMKKYQIEGLNWLIKLHDNNVNGILAGIVLFCYLFIIIFR